MELIGPNLQWVDGTLVVGSVTKLYTTRGTDYSRFLKGTHGSTPKMKAQIGENSVHTYEIRRLRSYVDWAASHPTEGNRTEIMES